MTPEQLQALVLAGASGPLIEALAPLREDARRKLSKTAWALFQSVDPLSSQRFPALATGESQAVIRSAMLAVLGCCEGTQAKRLRAFWPAPEAMLAVLVARRPAWIEGWIAHQLGQRWIAGDFWPVVRGLLRAGIIGPPAPGPYIRLMITSFAWTQQAKSAAPVPLSTWLKEDKGLLETEIWLLFETEHPAFARDYLQGRRPEDYETWTVALTRLAQAGAIDRARLIDSVLRAMASGLKPASIGGFVSFAAALQISTEEFSVRQAMLCQLMTNPLGIVVSFALGALTRLEKARLLDRDALLEVSEAAVTFPKKSPAAAAIALLAKLAKNDESRRPRYLLAAARALSNVSPDVQRRAAELIEAYPAAADPLLKESVRAQIEFVAPTIRERLAAWSTCDAERAQAAASAPASADASDIESRVARLPAALIERWGIDQALEGWRGGPGAPASPTVASQAADYRPIVPIASPDELLEAIALAVETVSGADDIERLVDGMARFADRGPDSKVAQTVFKRFLKPTSMKGLTSSLGVPPPLIALFARWFGAEWNTRAQFNEPESWWTARFEPHLKALVERRAWQPLSTPTHAGGFIDPAVWVARLNASGDIHDTDGIQSLLRLAPFGRTAARESLGSITGVWHRLADYALGGASRPGLTDLLRAPLWLAAGRARQPAGDLTELPMWPGAGVSSVPDAVRESRFTLAPKSAEAKGFRSHKAEQTFLPLEEGFDGDVGTRMRDIPQCLFYPKKSTLGFSLEWVAPWVIEWKAQIWPANLRGFLYWGMNRMLQRFDAGSSAYEPTYAYIDALRPKPRTLGEVECLALAIGCMSAEQETRRSAAEVLILAGVEGRLEARSFAAALEVLYAQGWFSINRLATTLKGAARDAPQTARVIVDALFAFLARRNDLPKGAHEVLELLYQECHRLGMAAPEPLKAMLAEQVGTTKTGRLAKDLLELDDHGARATAAARQAVERLLERAEAEL